MSVKKSTSNRDKAKLSCQMYWLLCVVSHVLLHHPELSHRLRSVGIHAYRYSLVVPSKTSPSLLLQKTNDSCDLLSKSQSILPIHPHTQSLPPITTFPPSSPPPPPFFPNANLGGILPVFLCCSWYMPFFCFWKDKIRNRVQYHTCYRESSLSCNMNLLFIRI